MRVISFSTDRLLFDREGVVYTRHLRYAESLGELHVIVFSQKGSPEPIHDGPLHIYPTNSKSRWLYGWDAIRIARSLRKPEVISAQDPFETGVAACVLAWFSHVPLHVQVHTDFLARGYAKHSKLNRVRVFLARFVFRHAKGIRVVAPRIKKSIEQKYAPNAPVSVLPIFVDVARSHTVRHVNHPRFETSLVFVGRLEREKRPDIAIKSLARMRSIGVDAGLTIVGEGSLRKQLALFAKQQKVAEYVNFVGHQDPLPHYSHADVVLVPSEYEGYGLVIVEALAAGVLVLSTDVGVAQEAGAMIAPYDSDGFAGELCALFARPELPKGRLLSYPYKSEEEYIAAYVAEISACAVQKTT